MTASTATETRLLDHAHGCLLGVALGDAMGMPGELWPRDRVRTHFGWIEEFLPGPDGHFVVDGFVAGQVTDDTQQAFMLADAIIEGDGEVDVATVARHLVGWADRVGASEGNFLGPSSARAIEKLRGGADPTTTGQGGETNGAAMRIAPVGLVRRSDDLSALVDAVVGATLMSHDTSIAVSGAALVAGVISGALDNLDVAPSDRLEHALAVGYRAAALGLERGEKVVAASVVSRSELARDMAQSSTDDDQFLQNLYDLVGASVATAETVPAAIGLVARTQADPVRTAILAANLGGDTDTIGAIATGMAGAITGATAIPADLTETLRTVNDIDPATIASRLVSLRR